MHSQAPVGAAEGCDFLILIFAEADTAEINSKRSQPSAAPTGDGVASLLALALFRYV
jgi:hypothetical protein